jgi:hypothetical protein
MVDHAHGTICTQAQFALVSWHGQGRRVRLLSLPPAFPNVRMAVSALGMRERPPLFVFVQGRGQGLRARLSSIPLVKTVLMEVSVHGTAWATRCCVNALRDGAELIARKKIHHFAHRVATREERVHGMILVAPLPATATQAGRERRAPYQRLLFVNRHARMADFASSMESRRCVCAQNGGTGHLALMRQHRVVLGTAKTGAFVSGIRMEQILPVSVPLDGPETHAPKWFLLYAVRRANTVYVAGTLWRQAPRVTVHNHGLGLLVLWLQYRPVRLRVLTPGRVFGVRLRYLSLSANAKLPGQEPLARP